MPKHNRPAIEEQSPVKRLLKWLIEVWCTPRYPQLDKSATSSETMPEIIPLLSDLAVSMRYRQIGTLIKHGGPYAVDYLGKVILDRNEHLSIRSLALCGIVRNGRPEILVPYLLKALDRHTVPLALDVELRNQMACKLGLLASDLISRRDGEKVLNSLRRIRDKKGQDIRFRDSIREAIFMIEAARRGPIEDIIWPRNAAPPSFRPYFL